MITKKLLTLAGIVGILVCGACFLPPLPHHEPSFPPTGYWFGGIQNLRVEVVNTSPTHHLNPDTMAQKVVEAINKQSWTNINAHVGKKAGGDDGVLVITILSETIDTTPSKVGSTLFLIKDSIMLTRRDGVLVWQQAKNEHWIPYRIDEKNRADVWETPSLVDHVEKELSDELAYRMFAWRG